MNETQLLLGKLIGEVYRIQNANEMACTVTEAQIFGLLHGFEHCINEELERVGFISEEKVDAAAEVLDEFFSDEDKLQTFKGFYDIEHKLEAKGISRMEASRILTYFNANHQFNELIAKMDSSNSPIECRTFNLSDSDK